MQPCPKPHNARGLGEGGGVPRSCSASSQLWGVNTGPPDGCVPYPGGRWFSYLTAEGDNIMDLMCVFLSAAFGGQDECRS